MLVNVPSFLFSTFFVLTPLLFCNAQEEIYDSLLTRYQDESLPDTTRINALITLGGSQFSSSYPDSLRDYLQEARPLIEEKGSVGNLIDCLWKISQTYYFSEKYLESLEHLTVAENKARELQDTLGLIAILNTKMNCYFYLSSLSKAVETGITALILAEKINYQPYINGPKNSIGLIYLELGEYDKARTYLIEYLAGMKAENNITGQITALSNIGLSYREEKNWDESLKHELAAYELIKEILPWKYAPTVILNIGSSYLNGGNRDSAQVYLYRGLAMAEQMNETIPIAEGTFLMARFHQVAEPDSAIYYGEKALSLASKLENKFILKNTSEILYQVYEETGQYQKALTTHKLWKTTLDSIYNEENQRSLYQAEAKYEYEKQKLKDQVEYEQELASTKLRSLTKFYILLGSSILGIIGFGFFLQSRKNRRDRETDKLLHEINLLRERVAITSISVNGMRQELQLNKEKIEAHIDTHLGESSWNILLTIFEDPTIGNREIGEKVFLSVEGVSSSLRRMYKTFDISSSGNQNMKVALVAKAMKISLEE